MYALFTSDYIPFKSGKTYRIINQSQDWIKVKCKGTGWYIPCNFIHNNPIETLFQDNNTCNNESIIYDYDHYDDLHWEYLNLEDTIFM